jgi:hypothetical protein
VLAGGRLRWPLHQAVSSPTNPAKGGRRHPLITQHRFQRQSNSYHSWDTEFTDRHFFPELLGHRLLHSVLLRPSCCFQELLRSTQNLLDPTSSSDVCLSTLPPSCPLLRKTSLWTVHSNVPPLRLTPPPPDPRLLPEHCPHSLPPRCWVPWGKSSPVLL